MGRSFPVWRNGCWMVQTPVAGRCWSVRQEQAEADCERRAAEVVVVVHCGGMVVDSMVQKRHGVEVVIEIEEVGEVSGLYEPCSQAPFPREGQHL